MNENEIIKKLETQFDTNLFKTKTFWYYPILKISVYFGLTYKSNTKTSVFSNLKQVFSGFINSLQNKSLKKTDILTVSSSLYYRKKNNNKFENTFFYFLKDVFPNKKITNLIYFDTSKMKRKNIAEQNIYIPDFKLYIALFLSKFKKKKVLNFDKKLLNNYLVASGSNITDSSIEAKLQKHEIYIRFFERLLQKTNPKIVIMLWHYNFWNFALSYACKKNNIKVIEIQHGIISENHLAYIYNTVKETNLFPDYIFTFGDFFSNIISKNTTTFNKNNIKSVGFPFLEQEKKTQFIPTKNLANFIKGNKIIVVMSQKTIRTELQNFILKLSQKLPMNYKIIYKIHPIETDYSIFYKKFKNINNIYLLAGSKYNSLDLLKIADIHTTVHSTTVFEAIALEKITILLNNDKYNYEFDNYIDNEIVWRAKTVSEYIKIINKIENNKTENKINSEKFYKTNSISNFKSELEKIINFKNEI